MYDPDVKISTTTIPVDRSRCDRSCRPAGWKALSKLSFKVESTKTVREGVHAMETIIQGYQGRSEALAKAAACRIVIFGRIRIPCGSILSLSIYPSLTLAMSFLVDLA